MAKDIFGDDYFDRHRDTSIWNSLGKKKIHEALNIKNKPKPKMDEILPPKEEPVKQEDLPQEIMDEEFTEHNKKPTSNSDWRKSYFDTVLAGAVGGIIVVLILQMNILSYDIAETAFWINAGIVLVVGLVFISVVGMLYKFFTQ